MNKLVDKILSELQAVGCSHIPKKAIYNRLMGDEKALKPFMGDEEAPSELEKDMNIINSWAGQQSMHKAVIILRLRLKKYGVEKISELSNENRKTLMKQIEGEIQ